MVTQTPGKIFLADERGLAESDRFRRLSTFNFGSFAHPHKGPFGRLYGLNEETLAAQHFLDFSVAVASWVLIVPITGAVALDGGSALPPCTVEAEETLLLPLPAGSVLRVRNPYEQDLVSFLHLWFVADPNAGSATARRSSFRVEGLQNQLLPITPAPATAGLPFRASLGRFAGRCEATFPLRSSESSFFAFVLAGAFEVESRLLHEKDGLALWDVAEVELEALSNDALLLVLELYPLAKA